MNKKKKISLAIIAVSTAFVLSISGTFAWRSINQIALNEVNKTNNPGGRLHDDFNGSNKDIYVENFTSEEDGAPIFARIRLYEYLEIGEGAGSAVDGGVDRSNVKIIGTNETNAVPSIDDKSSWAVHYYPDDSGDSHGHDLIHSYWSLHYGGSTVYMPTFNKNKDSLAFDINGTLQGINGKAYDDYVEYQLNDTKTSDEYYDADDNKIDEDSTKKGNGGTLDVNYKEEKDIEHTAVGTLNAEVMSMAEWKRQRRPVGAIWVYDTDGWAYWAQAIEPSTATGLLLDGINLGTDPDEPYYYAINVVAQFASAGDWGNKNSDDSNEKGFYLDGLSDDALYLLNQAAGRLPQIVKISIVNGNNQSIASGNTLALSIDADVLYPSDNGLEDYAVWTSDNAEAQAVLSEDGKFTPTEGMVGKTYKIKATSVYDETKTAEVNILVLPSDATGSITVADGTVWADYGDNTYRKLNTETNSFETDFICAGLNQSISDADDKKNVYVMDSTNPAYATYGARYLPTDIENIYQAKGADGKLGTEDDIYVIGNPWPNSITDNITYGLSITGPEGNKIKADTSATLKATLTVNGTTVDNNELKYNWSLTGNSSSSTAIGSSTGLLSIGLDEPADTTLTVKVTSTYNGTELSQSLNISTTSLTFEDIAKVTPQSTVTVKIDDVDFYILSRDDASGETLLWAKNPVVEAKFIDDSNTAGVISWSDSNPSRLKLQEWLASTSILKSKAITKTIYTRTVHSDANNYTETSDNVFILSEGDVYGTFGGNSISDAKEYTNGSGRIVTNTSLIPFDSTGFSTNWAWLRTPMWLDGYSRVLVNTGGIAHNATPYRASNGLRPALYISYK